MLHKLQAMLDTTPARLQKAATIIAALEAASPPLSEGLDQLEAASIHVNFVSDLSQVAPLFALTSPADLPTQLADFHARLERLDQRILRQAAATPAQIPPRFQSWIAQQSAPASCKVPAKPFANYLENTHFAFDGMEVSLAEFKALHSVAPRSVTPDLIEALESHALHIATAFVACLQETYAHSGARECALRSTLDLPPEITKTLSARPVAEIPVDTTAIFANPEAVIDHVRSTLCKGNTLAPVIAPMFEHAHILLGKNGPAFSFTIAPDPEKPPFIYVPFTGGMLDAVLLHHQIGHAVHARLALNAHSNMALLAPADDEIIPVLFEFQCYQSMADQAPDQVENQRLARQAVTENDIAEYCFWRAQIETVDTLTAASFLHQIQTNSQIPLHRAFIDGAAFGPLPLSSFAYGAWLARAAYEAHGWDEQLILERAQ